MNAENNRAKFRELIAPVDDSLVDKLMQGAVDLHVHSGPSIMERQVDHFEGSCQTNENSHQIASAA